MSSTVGLEELIKSFNMGLHAEFGPEQMSRYKLGRVETIEDCSDEKSFGVVVKMNNGQSFTFTCSKSDVGVDFEIARFALASLELLRPRSKNWDMGFSPHGVR